MAECRCNGFRWLERPDGSLVPCSCLLGPDLWRRSGLPERFFPAEVILAPAESCYLWGPPGAGKTWEAAGRLKGALASGLRGRFAYMPDLELQRRAAVTLGEELPGADYLDAPFLVVDDLLREPRLTDFWQEYLVTLVARRHARELPTVITSNRPLEEVERRLGEHVASRIVELCGTPREVAGRNRRIA